MLDFVIQLEQRTQALERFKVRQQKILLSLLQDELLNTLNNKNQLNNESLGRS